MAGGKGAVSPGAGSGRVRRLTVLSGLETARQHDGDATDDEWFRAAAAKLWPAWKGLTSWEEIVAAELPELLGDVILLLWSVHRLGESSAGRAMLDAAVGEDLRPTMSDPILDDIVELAFALGAAWADDRHAIETPTEHAPSAR